MAKLSLIKKALKNAPKKPAEPRSDSLKKRLENKKPKTFASEMAALNKMAMTDAARQAAAIKIAKKYGKPITIGGKSFAPPKKKPYNELSAAEKKALKDKANKDQVELNVSRGLMNKGGMGKKKKK